MLKQFKPTWLMSSYLDITPEFLKEHRIDTVFTDLDNTLIAWDEPYATDELTQWVVQLREANIDVVLVSNNNAKRIGIVADALEVPFVYPALKPLHKGMKAALELVKKDKSSIVMIGDQVMTDILSASTFGIRSVLVQPVKSSDGWKTRINRGFERVILRHVLSDEEKNQWGNKP